MYAALFHRPAPCSRTRSEVLKPLLVNLFLVSGKKNVLLVLIDETVLFVLFVVFVKANQLNQLN